MTSDELDGLIELAIDALGRSEAMDPRAATKAQSLEFLGAVEFWVESHMEALEHELGS